MSHHIALQDQLSDWSDGEEKPPRRWNQTPGRYNQPNHDTHSLPVIKEVKEKHRMMNPPMRKTPNPYVKNMKSLNLSSSEAYRTAHGFSTRKWANADLRYENTVDVSLPDWDPGMSISEGQPAKWRDRTISNPRMPWDSIKGPHKVYITSKLRARSTAKQFGKGSGAIKPIDQKPFNLFQ